MHQEARRKLSDNPRVRYIEADILSWEPDRPYDLVFFANWLSHVPPADFGHFWGTVRDALVPKGRIFLVDEAKDAWRYEHLREVFVAGKTEVVTRSLRDGRTFNVVKVFWDPDELTARLRALGWHISASVAGPFFWAEGHQPARRCCVLPTDTQSPTVRIRGSTDASVPDFRGSPSFSF
jgi:SAM-dependent methyltransferase